MDFKPLLTPLDGSTCLEKNCCECCKETEMMLTGKDVERLERLGFKRDEFCVRDGNFLKLRNIKGLCFFLDPGKGLCTVYENRPEGCRIYPIVFDLLRRKCILDKTCPYRDMVSEEELLENCETVQMLVARLIRGAP